MRKILTVLALLVEMAGGVTAADPPKTAKSPSCVCSDGCKCQSGTCPGSCPTEIPYAEAVAAAQRGERVTVFYQCPADKDVAGKFAVCKDASPPPGPGRYVTRRDESGRWGVDPVRLLVIYAAPTARPPAVFGGVRLPGNCVGGV